MSLKITHECINCDVCESACPNQAIYQGVDIYEINPDLCTQCVGHYPEPQCQIVCPINCIELDPNHAESTEQLYSKFQLLSKKPT